MASLNIQKICKNYGRTEVLKDIDISVEHGDFLVLVGPSGCGKSTLLNMIAGLEEITSGEIAIGGERVNERHPSKRDIAMVFQSYALYPNMRVEENIAFGLEMRGVSKSERAAAVAKVAEMLQIEHLLKRKPGALSGGQRQRVAMGRALVRDPKIFLFDEPLSNLDAKLRVDMRTEIKRLHQRLGSTIVYVTHDQIEAMTLATTIAVMKDGIVQQLGTPDDIYNRPANTFVASFMGSPAMNLLPGKLVRAPSSLAIQVGEGDQAAVLALPAVDGQGELGEGREVMLGLRPEMVTDPISAQAIGHETVNLRCPVEVAEPTGADIYASTRIGGHAITARLRAGLALSAGTETEFAVDMSRAVVFDAKTEQRIV
ncbi:MAG: ABC transporter ATP-binding protein [Granulosicoccaceae bacterium]